MNTDGRSTITWPAIDCSAAQMFTISPGSSASVGIGSSGAGSTSSPVAASLVGQRLHELHVAVLHRGGGVEHGVLRREAEHHRRRRRTGGRRRSSTTGSVDRFAIAAATLIATQVLPTPPLVENTDDQAPGRPGTRGRSWHASAWRRRAARRRGRPTGGGSPRRRSRPRRGRRRAAPAGARRSTARRPRRPRRATACELVTRCTCWKPIGLANPGPNTATTGRAGLELLDEVLDRLELRGAGELDREPRAQVRVGLDDGDVEARRRLDAGSRPWRRTPRRYLLLAAALAAPAVGAGWSGGSSTR